MGRGIGTRLVAGGHSVTFVDANPETADKTAEVKASAKNGAKISTSSLGEVELGDVVVLAVWYGTNIELAKQLGRKLAGKVVVDIANPLNSTYDGLATAPTILLLPRIWQGRLLPVPKWSRRSTPPMPARCSRRRSPVSRWMSLSPATTRMRREKSRSWSEMAACAPSMPAP